MVINTLDHTHFCSLRLYCRRVISHAYLCILLPYSANFQQKIFILDCSWLTTCSKNHKCSNTSKAQLRVVDSPFPLRSLRLSKMGDKKLFLGCPINTRNLAWQLCSKCVIRLSFSRVPFGLGKNTKFHSRFPNAKYDDSNRSNGRPFIRGKTCRNKLFNWFFFM